MLITIMVRLVMQVQLLFFHNSPIAFVRFFSGGQLARFHGDDRPVPAGAGVDGQDGAEQPEQEALPASPARWLTPCPTT